MMFLSDVSKSDGFFEVLAALTLSMGREIQYGGLVSLRHMMDASRQNRYFWPLGQDGAVGLGEGSQFKGQGLGFFLLPKNRAGFGTEFLGETSLSSKCQNYVCTCLHHGIRCINLPVSNRSF